MKASGTDLTEGSLSTTEFIVYVRSKPGNLFSANYFDQSASGLMLLMHLLFILYTKSSHEGDRCW